MFRMIASVKPIVWLLAVLLVCFTVLSVVLPMTQLIPGQVVLYVVEPLIAMGIVAVAYYAGRGQSDRVRHKGEKALIIGSVIAVWFVAYFASGVVLTYQHNAVAASPMAIITNIFAFGIVAAAVEYVRHTTMLLGGRRNVMWLGSIVSVLCALAQINVVQLASLSSGLDIIKFVIASVVPALAGSFLLTYLAINAGLVSQLTFRLGFLAAALLPPIIPKYDWYLTGIVNVLLIVAVYITIDRTRRDIEERGRHYHHAHRAYDVMFIIVMIALVLFMTGMFSYKPVAILSNSMKPVFSRGDIVIVQKAAAVDVNVGDIVQYNASGHMITHRIIRIDFTADGSGQKLYITKGDNSPSEDQPVRADQIMGIIRAEVPYVGYPSVWLSEMMK